MISGALSLHGLHVALVLCRRPGYDPVAMLRWSIVRVFFRSFFAFIDAGKRYRKRDQGTYSALS